MNPFKYGCVVTGDNFCARPNLSGQLRSFIVSGQNVVVQGARRMGKSSLVRETIKGMRGWRLIYIDLYYISSVGDFCRRVMEGVAKANDSMPFLKKVLQLAARLRPTLAFSSVDGSPTISVDARVSDDPDSLAAAMGIVEKIAAEGKTCVVFDEFQDVLRLPDAQKLLAELRGTIQLQMDVPYLFLGSVRHEMSAIFTKPSSPFFKSAALFDVDALDEDCFGDFLVRRFAVGDRVVEKSAVRAFIQAADSVPGDVQELCAALWETTSTGAFVGTDDLGRAFEHIFARERKAFEKTIDALTPAQFRILKNMACEKSPKVFSAAFLVASGVRSVGTVRKALDRFAADELIDVSQSETRFVDPFFAAYLRTL